MFMDAKDQVVSSQFGRAETNLSGHWSVDFRPSELRKGWLVVSAINTNAEVRPET